MELRQQRISNIRNLSDYQARRRSNIVTRYDVRITTAIGRQPHSYARLRLDERQLDQLRRLVEGWR